MPYSYTLLSGDGSTTVFAFPFPYLERTHIGVKVNGVTTTFSWLTDSTVSISPAPGSGAIVEIRRVTPKDEPPVNFTDGSVLLEDSLDLLALFNLYCAQEAADGVSQSITQDATGKWDGQGRVATNFDDPLGATDLVTKGYLENTFSGSLNGAVAAAEAARDGAEDAQGLAEQALDQFKEVYQGGLANDPTTRYDGSPLQAGDLYLNTAGSGLRYYTGSVWSSAGTGFVSSPSSPVVATAGQTVVPVPGGYTPFAIVVVLDGAVLSGSDVNVSSGTNIVFTAPLALNQEVSWVAFSSFSVASLAVNSVSTLAIQNDAVTTAKIADSNVTTSKIADNNVTTAKLAPATVSDLPWLSKAVGEIFYLRDDLAGVSAPPTGSALYRYLKLSYGDSYNTGITTGESLTGSVPQVISTAQIALSGSPINGLTVSLINTERRVLRAGSAGTVEQDAMQGHIHNVTGYNSFGVANGGSTSLANTGGAGFPVSGPNTDGTNGTPRTAIETRVKSLGVTAYMRIK